MKLTIVEKNLLSWTAMHIDFVMYKKQSFEKKHTVCFIRVRHVSSALVFSNILPLRDLKRRPETKLNQKQGWLLIGLKSFKRFKPIKMIIIKIKFIKISMQEADLKN